MKKICLVGAVLVSLICLQAQTIKAKLDAAVKQLEKDEQLKHGIVAFSVNDAATGKAVFEKNGELGLAPASTQKIFTSIAAFELLGKNYRYKTSFGFEGRPQSDSILRSPLYVVPSGDPSFGSWRFLSTKPENIITSIIHALKTKGAKAWWGGVILIDNRFESKAIPDGWIWEDIGNYYGAGHYDLNWNENQYDLVMKPSNKPNDSVKLVATRPDVNLGIEFVNELKTGTKNSGDNAYIYFEPLYSQLYIRGTIPCCLDSFAISGSFDGRDLFFGAIGTFLRENKLVNDRMTLHFWKYPKNKPDFENLIDHYSPPLDSLNYYFLRRSINLYGEAFIRTLAREKAGVGSTEKGIELVRDFFQTKGIEKSAIDLLDGSGLSPQNRVTTNSLTQALKYAKSRDWFSSFYYALPEINGMKMKSGSIGGVRSYAGYQKAKNGKEYIFSIIVNNYNGSSTEINKKLYKILDLLK